MREVILDVSYEDVKLERRGLNVAIMPRDSFFMKPLVAAIVAALSR